MFCQISDDVLSTILNDAKPVHAELDKLDGTDKNQLDNVSLLFGTKSIINQSQPET